ncbi:ABC transporter permease [Miniphocaeibacter massiliensis]|uniref:ABC transporter permease n=1 Tax=Miniphocaeibacter massiliensis TaxID=2041841 RepID=UPI000C081044|nr:ABC transporter permease [Miniphocaeibacter massiliensis]
MVNKLKKFYVFLIFVFLYAPIVFLMVFSFNNSKLKTTWTGFTFKWYEELFKNEEILTAFTNTILVAVITTIIATILGTTAAIGIYYMKKWKKSLILNINYIPVLNPDIVTAVSLMVLYRLVNMENGFLTVVLSHIMFTTPYVVLSVLPKLKQMSRSLPEAAMDLGATPLYTFRKIIIPEIKPGIFSGMILAFTLSLDDFVVSYFTTGNGFNTLSVTIFSMARRGINPAINALSTLMFLAILILLLVVYKTSKDPDELKR